MFADLRAIPEAAARLASLIPASPRISRSERFWLEALRDSGFTPSERETAAAILHAVDAGEPANPRALEWLSEIARTSSWTRERELAAGVLLEVQP